MTTRVATFRWGSVASFCICIFVAAFLLSCGFSPNGGPAPTVCSVYEGITAIPLTGQSSRTIFETAGTVIAIHGSGGATLNPGNPTGAIKVEQSVPIPPYVDRATVILNGWRLDYVGGDHSVLALGSAITDIRVDPKLHRVTWNALGLIRDNGGDKGYDWSYQFTVVAWNDANLNAFVDEGDFGLRNPNCAQTNGQLPDNYFYASNTGTTSSLSSFFSFLQNSIFAASKVVAILPRGFGFLWNDSDHNLFQMAYNMGHSEILAQNGLKYNKREQQVLAPVPNPPASHVDSGFVSWSPQAILADNDTRRDYTFAELVSGLGGNDVGIIQPPFSILPDNPDVPTLGIFSSCGGQSGSASASTAKFVIENIPYQFAIPVLAGWNVAYACNDRHVRRAGVWIDDWDYQPPSGGSGGTLSYTVSSVLTDDNATLSNASQNVAVLGLRPVALGSDVKGSKPTGPKTIKKS
jgi:hypothetical protein